MAVVSRYPSVIESLNLTIWCSGSLGNLAGQIGSALANSRTLNLVCEFPCLPKLIRSGARPAFARARERTRVGVPEHLRNINQPVAGPANILERDNFACLVDKFREDDTPFALQRVATPRVAQLA